MKTRIVLTLILLAAVAGCGSSSSDGRPTVVAAFYPLAFAAERVSGDSVDVRNLTPPGVEPHDLELSGQDVRTIADADLVLYLAGFQPSLDAAIESTSPPALDLLDDPGGDPHVWLDPVRYAQLTMLIAVELERVAGAERFVARLRALDRDLRRGLSRCERNEIVTSHAAFGHLAERYGLRQIAITDISPEAEPTPRELESVVRQVRAVGATTVFFETLVSPRLAETVAREVGARTAVLDPLEGLSDAQIAAGEDYFSVMRANLATLREALGCR